MLEKEVLSTRSMIGGVLMLFMSLLRFVDEAFDVAACRGVVEVGVESTIMEVAGESDFFLGEIVYMF